MIANIELIFRKNWLKLFLRCCDRIIRYQELYKTLLEKAEELRVRLDTQQEDNKQAFIEAKKTFEDKGVIAFNG